MVAIANSGENVAAVDQRGRLYMLQSSTRERLAPLATMVYLYRFDRKQWDTQPTVRCNWCGQRFTPHKAVLDATSDIADSYELTENEAPCLALPRDCWDDPRLLSDCTHCGQPVRFNPFIVSAPNTI